MIELTIPDIELYDEDREMFTVLKGGVVKFEHSLKSIMRWEARFKKPYISDEQMTRDEELYYYKCMAMNNNRLSSVQFTSEIQNDLRAYMGDPHTATSITELPSSAGKGKVITAEVIYGLMAAAGVPFDCDKWNINNLLMLLKVIGVQNGGQTKMSRQEIYKQNHALNAARRAKLGSRG